MAENQNYNKDPKKGADKTKSRRPVHQEHLDEIFTQDSVPSWLASVVFHLVLLVILVLIPAATNRTDTENKIEFENYGDEQVRDDNLLDDAMENEFQEEFQHKEKNTETEEEQIKFEYDKQYTTSAGLEDATLSPDLGVTTESFLGVGGGSGFRGDGTGLANYFRGNPGFGRAVGRLRGKGVDICIVFDSSDSMVDAIADTKENIDNLIWLVKTLVPSTQISILTYRDYNDAYVVQGRVLGTPIEDTKKWLNTVEAGGGGDHPEAVMKALEQAINANGDKWRKRARRVIILFGDAPPHYNEQEKTLNLVKNFHANKGLVSVIDTAVDPVHELEQIAKAGGGDYVRLTDAEKLSEQIFIQIFGSKYKAVLKKIWEHKAAQN